MHVYNKEKLTIELEKVEKAYRDIEDKHGRLLKRMNGYADELAELSFKRKRIVANLSLAKRSITKGDNKRG